MAVSSSVQFKGADAVVKAYTMRNVARWGIWQNRQFLFKYEGDDTNEGADQLQEILQMIAESPAVYTLKVFEGAGRVTEKTECDGSFNFKLQEPAEAVGGVGRVDPVIHTILDQQKEILKRLEMSEAEAMEPESAGAIGQIERVMQIPGVAQLVSGIVSRFLNPIQRGGAAIAGPPLYPATNTQQMESDQYNSLIEDRNEQQRLETAYLIIKSGMPDALGLLEKLAIIAQSDPAKFAGIKNSLSFFL